jgi:hypothetical protein
MQLLSVLIFVSLLTATSLQRAYAADSCSAENSNGDARCAISCQPGQTAECQDATGSNVPSCECKGDPDETVRMFRPAAPRAAPTTIGTTDVIQNINSKLATLKDYDLGQRCYPVEDGQVCHRYRCEVSPLDLKVVPTWAWCESCSPTYRQECRVVMGKLSATEPLTVIGDPVVKIFPPNWAQIPSSILGYKETYKNCTSLEQSTTFKHSRTVKMGSKVTKSKTLSTTTKIDAKVEFKFYAGAELGVGFSQNVSATSTDEENYERTEAIESSKPLRIAANTEVTYNHFWIQRDVPVGFAGTVVLDAAVSSNREGISRIAQLWPKEVDRTFDFAGQVSSSVLAEGRTEAIEKKLTATQCGNDRNKFIKTAAPYLKKCTQGKCVDVRAGP